jgi:VanZ family protein
MIYYLPPFLWALLIFILSSSPNPISFLPYETIWEIEHTRLFGIRGDNILWGFGHIFAYAVLAYLVIRALAYHRYFTPQQAWIAFAVTLLYGVSDEIHQLFVPGRGFQYYDILMDGVGALIGLGVFALHRLKRAQTLREEALML